MRLNGDLWEANRLLFALTHRSQQMKTLLGRVADLLEGYYITCPCGDSLPSPVVCERCKEAFQAIRTLRGGEIPDLPGP